MRLAKPHLDVGLFTNQLEPMLAFYQRNLAVPFDHMLPIGGGIRQHRHDLLGSVLKINHARHPLPGAGSAGYREVFIARPGEMEETALSDPDGNRIRVIPFGYRGITRIGVVIAVRDIGRHRRFLLEALAAAPLPEGEGRAFRIGDTVILLEMASGADHDPIYSSRGLSYLTVQVYDVDAEHAAVLKAGGAKGAAPRTLGSVARISFIRDPDGNWIELSQRASVTGQAITS